MLKKSIARLSLRKETVAKLSNTQLRSAAGGIVLGQSVWPNICAQPTTCCNDTSISVHLTPSNECLVLTVDCSGECNNSKR